MIDIVITHIIINLHNVPYYYAVLFVTLYTSGGIYIFRTCSSSLFGTIHNPFHKDHSQVLCKVLINIHIFKAIWNMKMVLHLSDLLELNINEIALADYNMHKY